MREKREALIRIVEVVVEVVVVLLVPCGLRMNQK